MVEIIFVFISVCIFTAVLFYRIGRDNYIRNHYVSSTDVVAEIYSMLAEEFYPGDPNGKMKIALKIRKRAGEGLKNMERAGL